MKRNIFIFHGTEGYPEENWFPWLKLELEKLGHKVFVPQFPTLPVVPAKISEWFNVLKKYEQNINQDTILIGHSLGGIFVLRILERIGHPVYASVFVGTPIGVQPIANFERDNSFSGFSFEWDKIRKNSGNVLVYQSDNDPYVGFANGRELAKNLKTNLSFIPSAGHFNAKAGYLTFPDLLDKITKML